MLPCRCVPEGITARGKILVAKSSQAELSSRAGASGAPGSSRVTGQSLPLLPFVLAPRVFLQCFLFCHPSFFAAEERRRPSSSRLCWAQKSAWMCRGARQVLGKGMPCSHEALAHREMLFLLEFPFQGQLIPFGGWLRPWGCREGPGHRGKAFGTRTSCKLSTNPRSVSHGSDSCSRNPTGI